MRSTPKADTALLTTEARNVIAKFLKRKPNKAVIVCEKGFLDQVEGVPVSDAEAIKWVESFGKPFSALFTK